jgi:uncharacterized protein
MNIVRHASAESFLRAAGPLLMMAEAENNLIIGVAQGLARKPSVAVNPYLATVDDGTRTLACAVHIAPFKLLLTRADREPVIALARDAYDAVPELEGISGPDRSAADFAGEWKRLSGSPPQIGMRLRIHETRDVADLPMPAGRLRQAQPSDLDELTVWTRAFVKEAGIAEDVDASAVVNGGITNGRLHVWDTGRPASMAAWSGKTPSGVRLHFIYTPPDLRRSGYATACVSALTLEQLRSGSAFCWIYTALSGSAPPNFLRRIGYRPVVDVTELSFSA